MTRDQLCSEIAKRESKKVQVSIGNIREVMRILIDLQTEFTLSDNMKVDESPVFIILAEVDKKVNKAIEKQLKKKPKTLRKNQKRVSM